MHIGVDLARCVIGSLSAFKRPGSYHCGTGGGEERDQVQKFVACVDKLLQTGGLGTKFCAVFVGLSRGAFDITVKPVLEVYDRAFDRWERVPTESEIDSVRTALGFERVTVEGQTITLAPGTRLDLGGLAKGYIIDRAVTALRRAGISDGLVDAGGDIRAFGSNNGEPWRIALQNPRDPADFLAVIELTDRSVTTSGDYERYFDPEREYHHIIDPRTGRSATVLISATIVADLALDADALSTSVFVLGPDEGLALVEELAGIEALLITRDREIITSTGMADFIRGSVREAGRGR